MPSYLLDHQNTFTPISKPVTPQHEEEANGQVEDILRKKIEETNQKISDYFKQ